MVVYRSTQYGTGVQQEKSQDPSLVDQFALEEEVVEIIYIEDEDEEDIEYEIIEEIVEEEEE